MLVSIALAFESVCRPHTGRPHTRLATCVVRRTASCVGLRTVSSESLNRGKLSVWAGTNQRGWSVSFLFTFIIGNIEMSIYLLRFLMNKAQMTITVSLHILSQRPAG